MTVIVKEIENQRWVCRTHLFQFIEAPLKVQSRIQKRSMHFRQSLATNTCFFVIQRKNWGPAFFARRTSTPLSPEAPLTMIRILRPTSLLLLGAALAACTDTPDSVTGPLRSSGARSEER